MKIRQMHKHSNGWIAAALLSSACVSPWAQAQATSTDKAAGMQQAHDMERIKTRHERHLQELKSKLQLKAEQESTWTIFAGAMTAPADLAAPGERLAQRAELAKLDTPERIDRIKAVRQQRQAQMNAWADRRGEAAKAFYASLSPQQKKVFDDETARLMQHRGGHGPKPHGGRHGHG